MTNEEAAAMLERMKNYFLPTSPMLEERREITALDLAISALSKRSASSEQADQCGNDTEMVELKLKKRTITERLIIAELLINSVIADSDQFRDSTKMTEDVPDIHVGKTDFKPGEKTEKIPHKKPEIIYCTECPKCWDSGTATINGQSYRIFKCSVWERPVSPFGFCYMAERRNDDSD